jgi:hypothetical protein
MKTQQWVSRKAALMLCIVTALIGCSDGGGGSSSPPPPPPPPPPVEQPKDQTVTITGLFDNNASATVKGFFTNAEWEGIPDTIKIALNNRFNTSGTVAKNSFKNVFAVVDGVMIIVEKTSEYSKYKTIGDGKTMYINFGILNDASALELALSNARSVMAGNNIPPME